MKVVTLNRKDFEKSVVKLSEHIDFNPDLIIGIPRGGKFVLAQIIKNHKFKNTKTFLFEVQRKTTKRKNHAIISYMISLLPYRISDLLRIFEANLVRKKNFRESNPETIVFPYSIDNGLKILIIDDAIDSGKSVLTVIESIKNKSINCFIKVAVVSWTFKDSLIKPDYYIYSNCLVRFPWSKDYRGNDKYE